MLMTIKTTVFCMWDRVVWYTQLRTPFCNPRCWANVWNMELQNRVPTVCTNTGWGWGGWETKI